MLARDCFYVFHDVIIEQKKENEMIKCSYDELLPIDSPKLIPHPKNPNVHSKEQIKRLAKILEYQGQRSSIVISKESGFIIVGHGRLEAMREFGFKEVAVNYQSFENEAQEYAHMVADNAIASWADLDLSSVNEEFVEFGPDFDLDLLGIENFNIDPLAEFKEEEKEVKEEKKLKLEISFENEMEYHDVKDDLISRGYAVREL